MERTPRIRHIIAIVAATLGAGCGDGSGPSAVASVAVSVTSGNVFVGGVSHVSATPLDADGAPVAGVSCAFTSATPAVAAIDASSGAVSALAVGVTQITATCGDKSGSLTVHVIPTHAVLRVVSAGTGSGTVSLDPSDTIFAYGTDVVLLAQAATGSRFDGWTGACQGGVVTCDVVMNADTVVTAKFVRVLEAPLTVLFPIARASCSWTGQLASSLVSITMAAQVGDSVRGVVRVSGIEHAEPTAGGCAADTRQYSATGFLTGTTSNATWQITFVTLPSADSYSGTFHGTLTGGVLTGTLDFSYGGNGGSGSATVSMTLQ